VEYCALALGTPFYKNNIQQSKENIILHMKYKESCAETVSSNLQNDWPAGLQDGMFSNQKSKLLHILEGLVIFYDHLVFL
jgi:hypothetical protein